MRKIEHQQGVKRYYTDLADEVTTQTARKTYVHLLNSLTKDLGRVKKELGNRDIETTMKYLDFTLDSDPMDLKNVKLGF